MDNSLEKVMRELADSYLKAFRTILKTRAGKNTKVNRNTLIDSNLYREAYATVGTEDNDPVANLIVNGYIQYIESGRKGIKEKPSQKKPPFNAILEWCIAKGLPRDNETVYKIMRAIQRDGIQPRILIEPLMQKMDRKMEDVYYDRIAETIFQRLNEYFRSK